MNNLEKALHLIEQEEKLLSNEISVSNEIDNQRISDLAKLSGICLDIADVWGRQKERKANEKPLVKFELRKMYVFIKKGCLPENRWVSNIGNGKVVFTNGIYGSEYQIQVDNLNNREFINSFNLSVPIFAGEDVDY